MSRCFPFPPPGYEIKTSPENVNLILKEKHKLKKHKNKKDKDEKEKKERRERKEKGRGEGKHKDGKDRKQKKHKDDTAKKDEHNSLEEKKTENFISKPSDGIKDYRILAELGKRVRNDVGATDNETVDKKIILVEQKHGHTLEVESKCSRNNETVEKKIILVEQKHGHTLEVEAKCSRNRFGGNFSEECQIDTNEKRNEGKEKYQNGNSGEGDKRDGHEKREDKKREDKKRINERKNEKKREKEMKEMKERSKENIKQRDDGNVLYSRDNNPSDILHLKENGFLHDNGFQPGKLSSSFNHVRNDGIISSHLCTNSTRVKQNFVENGRKRDNKEKELRMNGVLEGKMDISSTKTDEKKARISTKPPHADLKYLSKILTVPKLDLAPPFDDQDWVFGYKGSKSKRPKLDSSHVESHVWAEAIVLGPADFIAMPYVVPY